MSQVGMVSIVVGLVAVGMRLPQAVAPAASLRWLRKMARSGGRTRALGALMAAFGATMVWAGGSEDTTLATVLTVAGWGILGLSVPALIVFPTSFRALVEWFYPESAPGRETFLQMRGVFGVVVGAFLVWFGWQAL
ncbi:MAG: hypothetical protein VYE73_07305 [Acidobacteriota bacterium]|nr:hypothetical protein [Acidobacteriota bacterium]